MATDAQVKANKKNAARSTGPKTEKGKAKARGNALKHGGRAKVIDVMPVLPHEDPKLLEERIQTWLDDWRPRNDMESRLVRRGAKLSWLVERGERIEAAHLGHRVRKAMRKGGSAVSARRMKVVCDLGRKLFYDARPKDIGNPAPDWDDDPAVFVAGLEETAEGCRWLIARWGEMRTCMEAGRGWQHPDVYRFIRLLGKDGNEAIHDPALNATFMAWEVDMNEKELAQTLWKLCRKLRPMRDPAHNYYGAWRELGPRPADGAAAQAHLGAVMDERVARLEEMVAEYEAIAELEACERADRAAFDPSAGFDRFQRRQAALSRELLRTIDTLRRLKKEAVEPSVDSDEGPLPGASASTPPTQPRREEPHEHENATIEAKLESTQDKAEMEVTSIPDSYIDDDRTQSVAVPKDPSWDELPIVSLTPDHSRKTNRNGKLSHKGDPEHDD